MALEPLETAESSDYPSCRQISVFLENRLGQLLRLTRLFEQAHVHILGISVEGSVDCAIVRLLFDDPDAAHKLLTQARFPLTETEVLVVELNVRSGMMGVCQALISGEININYVYALLPGRKRQEACVAIQVEHLSQAATLLDAKGFRVLTQGEL